MFTMTPVLWFGLMAVLLVIEALTVGLTTIWFAGGALVAALASLFGAGDLIQWLLFFVISLALLIFTRPWAVEHLNKSVEKTNVDSLIGKTAVITAPVSNLEAKGEAVVDGMTWTARSADDAEEVPEGTKVEILAVQGVKLIVKKKEEG